MPTGSVTVKLSMFIHTQVRKIALKVIFFLPVNSRGGPYGIFSEGEYQSIEVDNLKGMKEIGRAHV